MNTPRYHLRKWNRPEEAKQQFNQPLCGTPIYTEYHTGDEKKVTCVDCVSLMLEARAAKPGVVMKITFGTDAPRKRPKVGDVRTTKKHGVQIRAFAKAKDSRGNVIGNLVSNGRPVYEWVSKGAEC